MEAILDAQLETRPEACTDGYVIGRGGAHSTAIYDRNGVSWVAEFQDGDGELTHANAWFYFHAERLGYWYPRRAYGPSQALPLWMLEEIERLHREKEAREAAPANPRRKFTLAEAAARLHLALGGGSRSR